MPVRFVTASFPIGFDLSIKGVAPPHQGLDLARVAGQLDALPDAATWSARMRTTLLTLSAPDARLLVSRLTPLLRPPHELISDYMVACKVLASHALALSAATSGSGLP
jgi:hypothetical protein